MSIRPSYGGNGIHRSSGNARINDLLESLKVELESMGRESNLVKLQKDEFERKLKQQIEETQSIQQQIYELERNHIKLRQKYDEEISMLRRQLQNISDIPTMVNNPSRSLTGDKRPLSSLEIGVAQNLESLAKRHLEIMPPGSTGPSGVMPGGGGGGGPPITSFPLSLSQIAKQAGTPKRVSASDSPKQTPASSPPMPMIHSAVSLPPGGNSSGLNSSNAPGPNPLANSSGPSTPSRGGGEIKQPPPESQNNNQTGSPQSPIHNPSSSSGPAGNTGNPGGSGSGQGPTQSQPSSPKYGPLSNARSSFTFPNESEVEGNDWVIGYNPSVLKKLEVKLDYDLIHESVVCCVNFSGDGKYLATGCNRSAQIFDVKTGNKLHIFRDKPELETDLYIRSVCFSPDGKYLATGAEDKTVKLWDIEKEQIWHNLAGHEVDIYSLDFLPDGKLILSGSGDKKVKIWRIEDEKCILTLGDETSIGPKDGVTSISISPDGRQVAAGSLDRMVRVWDIETGIFLGTYEGHTDSVYSVAFSPDGKTLASGSLDRTIKLWDSNRQHRRCRSTLSGHRDFVLSVAFSPDGNWLASGSKDRSVQFWDPRSSLTHMILQGHRNSVISVAVTGEKDGSSGKLSTGSGDWRARIWNFKGNLN